MSNPEILSELQGALTFVVNIRYTYVEFLITCLTIVTLIFIEAFF